MRLFSKLLLNQVIMSQLFLKLNSLQFIISQRYAYFLKTTLYYWHNRKKSLLVVKNEKKLSWQVEWGTTLKVSPVIHVE